MDEPTPIFAALVDEYRAGRHHWRDDDHDPDTGEVSTVGRHLDSDGDGLADQADPDPHGLDPYGTGDGSYPTGWPTGWHIDDPTPQPADGPCEDRHDPSSWLDPDIVDDPTEGG